MLLWNLSGRIFSSDCTAYSHTTRSRLYPSGCFCVDHGHLTPLPPYVRPLTTLSVDLALAVFAARFGASPFSFSVSPASAWSACWTPYSFSSDRDRLLLIECCLAGSWPLIGDPE
jgi:hypothetical protein